MTRSTDSRRARNSASVRIGARRRPASRPSRRRCRLASRRADPLRAVASSERELLGSRTWTVVRSGSSGSIPASWPRRRRRRRRRELLPVSSLESSCLSPVSSNSSASATEPVSALCSLEPRRPRPPRRRRRRELPELDSSPSWAADASPDDASEAALADTVVFFAERRELADFSGLAAELSSGAWNSGAVAAGAAFISVDLSRVEVSSDFLAVDFFAVDFFAVLSLAGLSLAADFSAVDFLAGDFFAADFSAVDFLAGAVASSPLSVAFFAVDFLAVDFLAGLSLAVDFLAGLSLAGVSVIDVGGPAGRVAALRGVRRAGVVEPVGSSFVSTMRSVVLSRPRAHQRRAGPRVIRRSPGRALSGSTGCPGRESLRSPRGLRRADHRSIPRR